MINMTRTPGAILIFCALLTGPESYAQEPASIESLEIHQLTEAGRKVLPLGGTLWLQAGDQVTLLANALDRGGKSAIDWDPRWSEGKTGFHISARGTWAELTATMTGAYTLVLQSGEKGPVTYLNLNVGGDGQPSAPVEPAPPAPVAETPPIDNALTGVAVRLELHLIQETATRVIPQGDSVIGVIGNAYKFEARAFDAAGLRTSLFEPTWSPAPPGLDATIFEETAKMYATAPGTYAMYVWDRVDPQVSTSMVLVVHDSPTTPVGPPTPPAATTYRSEVHRICSSLDSQYVRLLSAWQGRNDGEMRVSAHEFVRLGRRLNEQKPDGFLVLWHAPDLVQNARDILEELRDTNKRGLPSYGDIRDDITQMRTNCMDCHRAHNSSFIPRAVPRR